MNYLATELARYQKRNLFSGRKHCSTSLTAGRLNSFIPIAEHIGIIPFGYEISSFTVQISMRFNFEI